MVDCLPQLSLPPTGCESVISIRTSYDNTGAQPSPFGIRGQIANQCAEDFKSLFAAIMPVLNWRVMQPKLPTGPPNTIQNGFTNRYRSEVVPVVFPAGAIEKPS